MTSPRPLLALTLAAVLLAAGCGAGATSTTTPEGLVVTGPGVRATAPPWSNGEDQLARRVRLMGLPDPGKETYHIHALLRIYDEGRLVPVATNIGLSDKQGVHTAIHTHDGTGVLHFEADKAFPHTLGDVFEVWGVTLGPGQLGALKSGDGRSLRAYVNGKPISDPAAYAIQKDDVIVLAYGTGKERIPLNPDTTALKDANAGKSTCSTGGGKKATSCLTKTGG